MLIRAVSAGTPFARAFEEHTTMFDAFVLRSGSLCVVVGLSATSCLTPPCQCGPGAATAEATAIPAEAAPSAAAAAAPGGKTVVWDGDETGGAGKGWQDCDKKAEGCKVTLGPEPGVGFNNTIGLKFHAEGPGWLGGGWNWFGWWPDNAGTDISGVKNLAFRMRVEAKSPEDAPDPGSLGIFLKCSSNKDKGQSNTASLVKLNKENLIDGKWHEVVVPIADIKKPEFDPKTTWEFAFTSWSPTPRNFNWYFDDIRFE